MAKKAEVTVPKAKYDAAIFAVGSGLLLLKQMEEAGALRLPYPGFAKTVKQMRDAVKR